MAYDWYEDFPRYVPASERRARAAVDKKKLEKKGRKLEPVLLQGRTIAGSFWGKAWCENLEAYGDLANRLPRGRSYVRNGSVVDLRISAGRVDALVSGSSLYEVTIEIDKLARKRWSGLVSRCKGRIDSVVELLRGELPEPLLAAMIDARSGLFPERKQIRFACSCPDTAFLCKHIAAVLYGVGARFDRAPETFFILRSVKLEELVSRSAGGVGKAPARGAKESAALEEIFGIELDRSPPRRSRR